MPARPHVARHRRMCCVHGAVVRTRGGGPCGSGGPCEAWGLGEQAERPQLAIGAPNSKQARQLCPGSRTVTPATCREASFACYRGLLITLRTMLIIGSNHLISQTGWNRCNIYIYIYISLSLWSVTHCNSLLGLKLCNLFFGTSTDNTKVTTYHLVSQAGWNRCILSISLSAFHVVLGDATNRFWGLPSSSSSSSLPGPARRYPGSA